MRGVVHQGFEPGLDGCAWGAGVAAADAATVGMATPAPLTLARLPCSAGPASGSHRGATEHSVTGRSTGTAVCVRVGFGWLRLKYGAGAVWLILEPSKMR